MEHESGDLKKERTNIRQSVYDETFSHRTCARIFLQGDSNSGKTGSLKLFTFYLLNHVRTLLFKREITNACIYIVEPIANISLEKLIYSQNDLLMIEEDIENQLKAYYVGNQFQSKFEKQDGDLPCFILELCKAKELLRIGICTQGDEDGALTKNDRRLFEGIDSLNPNVIADIAFEACRLGRYKTYEKCFLPKIKGEDYTEAITIQRIDSLLPSSCEKIMRMVQTTDLLWMAFCQWLNYGNSIWHTLFTAFNRSLNNPQSAFSATSVFTIK